MHHVFAQTTSSVSGGVIILTALSVGVVMVLVVASVHLDYRRHKRPLTEIDPSVVYSFWHHLRVVTIPRLRYRLATVRHTRLGS